ncbi:hypothetical protein [Dactylosporangium sp. CA-092794]|uniref:hypothetical protein n=1 Tax=Dactylosporangium sp. CA-092794 TaxID=3239929 RepID=UPI003D8AA2E0
MTALDKQTAQAQQAAAMAAVRDGLGPTPAEFGTAGELAQLMARLPAGTPVRIAETLRIDPALQLEETDNRTAAVVTVLTLADGTDPVDVLEDDGRIRTYGRVIPGIELGAVIVAEGTPAPARTTPFPPFERAQEALNAGDLAAALDAHVELLNWMAGTLTSAPAGLDAAPAVPDRITDDDLREQLAVEADRLRHAAGRLTVLRGRVVADLAGPGNGDEHSPA